MTAINSKAPSSSAAAAPPTTTATTTVSSRQVAIQAPSNATTSNSVRTPQRSQPHLPHIAPYPVHPISHPYHLYPSLRPPSPYLFSANTNPSNSKINPASSTIISQHHPQQGLPYPIPSSGQGFVQRPFPRISDPYYNQRSSLAVPYRTPVPHMDQVQQLSHRGHQYLNPVHLMRHASQQSALRHNSVVFHGANQSTAEASQQLKALPTSSSYFNPNGYKNSRDCNREEKIVTVRGRKVRIVDGTSLYALCRSWLRNGQTEEIQLPSVPNTQVLPRPLPLSMVEDQFPRGKEYTLDDEDKESVTDLSPKDLLKKHIKRAKKVRARFRDERLKRIARYKTRLALLLPLQGEQVRTDGSSED